MVEREPGAFETREQAIERAQSLVRRYIRRKPKTSVVVEFLRERRQEAAREDGAGLGGARRGKRKSSR